MGSNILEKYLLACKNKWEENSNLNNGLACQKWGSRWKTMKDAVRVVEAVDKELFKKDFLKEEQWYNISMMRFFKGLTILALTGSLFLDYYNGYPINIIYLFALIAVLFT